MIAYLVELIDGWRLVLQSDREDVERSEDRAERIVAAESVRFSCWFGRGFRLRSGLRRARGSRRAVGRGFRGRVRRELRQQHRTVGGGVVEQFLEYVSRVAFAQT